MKSIIDHLKRNKGSYLSGAVGLTTLGLIGKNEYDRHQSYKNFKKENESIIDSFRNSKQELEKMQKDYNDKIEKIKQENKVTEDLTGKNIKISQSVKSEDI